MLPRLKRDKRNWIILPALRPKVRPLEEFATTLAIALGTGHDWRRSRDLLAGEQAGAELPGISRDLRARTGAHEAQVLIPIDQFEELFAVSDGEEANCFFEVLSIALRHDMPFLAVGSWNVFACLSRRIPLAGKAGRFICAA